MSELAAKADSDSAELFKKRDGWLAAVMSAKLSGLTARVALALDTHFNRRSGEAWPSVERLARLTHATPRGVQKCLRALQAHGLISIQLGGGRGHANLYQLTMPQAERVNFSSSYVATKTANNREWKGRTNTTEKGEQSFTQNPLKEPLKKEPTQASEADLVRLKEVWRNLPANAKEKSSQRKFREAYQGLSAPPDWPDLERAARNWADSIEGADWVTPAHCWLTDLKFEDHLGPEKFRGALY